MNSKKSTNAAVRIVGQTKKRLSYLPGQLIIRFKEDAIPRVEPRALRSAARLTAAVRGIPEAVTGPIDYLCGTAGLAQVRPLFAEPVQARAKIPGIRAAASKLQVLASVGGLELGMLGGFNVATMDPKRITPALLRNLNASAAVEFVEPMPARWLAARRTDPMRGSQWGLHAIGWFDQQRPDADTVTVAVLDTGVDATHPDLKDVVAEYDHGSYGAEDVLGHGTHVCGIVAATVNNNVGISGIANTRLKVWKIFPDRPTEDDFYVDGERYLRALRAVEDSGARVLNLSIGGAASSQTETILFRRLLERDVSVVAAMGNEFEDGNPVEYPAAYEGVIAVGAVDPRLNRAVFSNTGRHLHVVAPGVDILSTLPVKKSRYRDQTRYASWDGTSMATPHVAGGAALLLAKSPRLTATGVRSALQKHAKRVPEMNGKKKTPEFGYGLLYLPNLLK